MGQNESMWTTSELVYLFVDGEADDIQKTRLFSALAGDSELQAELADAIRINSAVRDETADTAPPAALSAALFERAGIGAATSGALSSSALSDVVGSSATAGAWPFLKKIGLPLVTGFLGAVLALFLVPELGILQQNRGRLEGGTSNIISAERNVGVQTPNTNVKNEGKAFAAIPGESERSRRHHSLSRSALQFGGRSTHDNLLQSSLTNPSLLAVINAIANERRSEVLGSDALQSEQALATSSLMVRPELNQLSPHVAVGATSMLGTSESDVLHSVSQITTQRSRGPRFRFSTQLRGILGLETFPNRPLENGKSLNFENIALTALWHPFEGHGFGIEVGRERHPLYVKDDKIGGDDLLFLEIKGSANPIDINFTGTPTLPIVNSGTVSSKIEDKSVNYGEGNAQDTVNNYRLEPVVEWVGLAYQFKAGAIDSRGAIHPYVQTVVGATQSGPIGKATLGLSWKPEDRISFGLGVEGTSLFYRRGGEWYSSRKVGATYSVQVEF